jgi:N-acetyl-gamma-glutamyl-phosphate reductase
MLQKYAEVCIEWLMRVGVAGASGYVGGELLRWLSLHPAFELAAATGGRTAGTRLAEHTPSLAAAYPSLVLSADGPAAFEGCEVVFVALPHGRSQELIPALLREDRVVLDLGADFRLRDAGSWELWYGEAHGAPEHLAHAAYGLAERHRDEIRAAQLVAVPGCYPTATILGLGPLFDAGALSREVVIVDALSGSTGAGRTPSDRVHFSTLADDTVAYGLLDHRHTAEMEQELGASVLFTPHLVPIDRGMLVTAYARPAIEGLDTDGALGILHDAYDAEPFVVVTQAPPSPKAVRGTNVAHVTARVDPRTGHVLVLSAIDNLGKGAAGQAVQCANIAAGLPETSGLSLAGVWP